MELEKEKLLERLPGLAETFKEKSAELEGLISHMHEARRLIVRIRTIIDMVHESKAKNAYQIELLEKDMSDLLNELLKFDDLYIAFEGTNIIEKDFKRAEPLNWEKAERHLYTAKAYYEIDAASSIALNHVIMPLVKQFESGIRSKELYDEIFEISL